jgi:hypothetical protein
MSSVLKLWSSRLKFGMDVVNERFRATEGSLSSSKELATGLYPKPDLSTPYRISL